MQLDALKKQFPESVRVRRLEAMVKEAQGDARDATSAYKALIELDPTDAVRTYLC
jgi:cytochrome c-type biogenesis protein CcmH/NrfG